MFGGVEVRADLVVTSAQVYQYKSAPAYISLLELVIPREVLGLSRQTHLLIVCQPETEDRKFFPIKSWYQKPYHRYPECQKIKSEKVSVTAKMRVTGVIVENYQESSACCAVETPCVSLVTARKMGAVGRPRLSFGFVSNTNIIGL